MTAAPRVLAAALTTALTLLAVTGCTRDGDPGPATTSASAPARVPTAAPAPGPWGTDVVVSADCMLGARFAAVQLRAWDPRTWKVKAERVFDLPPEAVFSRDPGGPETLSPLVDLCRTNPDEAVYPSDALERVVPRVRALFDRDFTTLAVVLRTPDGKDSHVGYVRAGDRDGGRADLTARDRTATVGAHEQNAALSPDGTRVWFTYQLPSGRDRIGSRAIGGGDPGRRDEGPAVGAALPLVVVDGPPRGVQAELLRTAPDGLRTTVVRGSGPGVSVVELPDAPTVLAGAAVRGAREVPGCLHAVGWTGPERLLCRTESGGFRTVGTGPDAAPGPETRPGVRGSEGLLVSPDGSRFLLSEHPPGDPYDGFRGFRIVGTGAGTGAGTGPGGAVTPLTDPTLTGNTLFIEWR
ncbi:hypothetical protein [Streptomyces sp. NPDC090025]|uniref:hypothetical protein n=1 Tax=Streptomyces sp. NPDC090025 TaxID=3365922 RepID=UPI003836D84D